MLMHCCELKLPCILLINKEIELEEHTVLPGCPFMDGIIVPLILENFWSP